MFNGRHRYEKGPGIFFGQERKEKRGQRKKERVKNNRPKAIKTKHRHLVTIVAIVVRGESRE